MFWFITVKVVLCTFLCNMLNNINRRTYMIENADTFSYKQTLKGMFFKIVKSLLAMKQISKGQIFPKISLWCTSYWVCYNFRCHRPRPTIRVISSLPLTRAYVGRPFFSPFGEQVTASVLGDGDLPTSLDGCATWVAR